jgi:hypothetical protein
MGCLRVEGGDESIHRKRLDETRGFQREHAHQIRARARSHRWTSCIQATKRALDREGAGGFGVGMLHDDKTRRREKRLLSQCLFERNRGRRWRNSTPYPKVCTPRIGSRALMPCPRSSWIIFSPPGIGRNQPKMAVHIIELAL